MSEKMPNDHMDPMWKTHMEILMRRMRQSEIADRIDKALFDWYFERGMKVPDWKVKKDPDWWIEYLDDLNQKN
jgi:hypothetical protein